MFDTEIVFYRKKEIRLHKTPKRLVKLIHEIYKVPIKKVEKHLKFYRMDRDSPDVDWGPLPAFIERVVKFSFRHRHQRNQYVDVQSNGC